MSDPKFPRALVRKIESDEPILALAAIHDLRAYLDVLEAEHILKARELGASPTDIAQPLGITRQAVYNRLRSLDRRAPKDRVEIPELESPPAER